MHINKEIQSYLYPLLCYTEDIVVIQELGWVYNIKTIYQIGKIILFSIVKKQLLLWTIMIFEIIPYSLFSKWLSVLIVYQRYQTYLYTSLQQNTKILSQIKVQFVDYGTVATLHQDFLRRNLSFQEVPALAFPVRLNVKPKCTNWEKEELDFIHLPRSGL